MNIYFREIKAHKYSLLGWSVGMFFLITAGMAKYAAYNNSGQNMNDLIKTFPKSFMTIFGVGGFDLSHASGYFGVLFLYIALMGAIHAALISSDMIAKEERERTSEFLYVKPISRSRALTSKLLAALTNVIIFNLITMASSLLIVPKYANGEPLTHDILILMAGLFMIQLLFLALGAAIAGISKKPKGVPGVATGILLITYIFYVLINVNEKLSPLKYLSPFNYFDAKNILNDVSLSLFYLVLSITIIIVLTGVTYISYQKRDLSV